MKYFSILTPVLIISMILSACGAKPEAAPTINSVDLQSTMVAAAYTIVAQTQAAIPTATPLPPTAIPTDTPAPIDTLPPLPAPEVTLAAAPIDNSGGGDPCINTVLPRTLPGKTIKIRIGNSTKATLSLTVYLNSTVPQNQCGYRSYTLAPGQMLAINDLVEGCYTLWAWNPDPKDYFIVTNGTDCLDSSNNWTFDISTRDIRRR